MPSSSAASARSRLVAHSGTASADWTKLRRFVDIEELAEHLGVSVRHVRRLVSERRIPFHKWGHLLRFDIAEINAWLDTNKVEPSAGGPATSPSRPRDRRGR